MRQVIDATMTSGERTVRSASKRVVVVVVIYVNARSQCCENEMEHALDVRCVIPAKHLSSIRNHGDAWLTLL